MFGFRDKEKPRKQSASPTPHSQTEGGCTRLFCFRHAIGKEKETSFLSNHTKAVKGWSGPFHFAVVYTRHRPQRASRSVYDHRKTFGNKRFTERETSTHETFCELSQTSPARLNRVRLRVYNLVFAMFTSLDRMGLSSREQSRDPSSETVCWTCISSPVRRRAF